MPKKILYLDDLTDSLLSEGKKINQGFKISGSQDFGEGLYVYQITEKNRQFEVEIRRKGNAIYEWTCDCNDFERNQPCRHLLSVIHELREEFISSTDLDTTGQQKSIEEESTSIQGNDERLNLDHFLQVSSEEELDEFVRFYARKDRRFTHLFKARFAAELSWDPIDEKYGHILRSACKHSQNNQGLFSNNGRQHVDEILHEFCKHAEHFFSILDYQESFAICRSVFDILIPYFRRYRDEKMALELGLKPSFLLLKKLLNAPAGIQLKESIWEKLSFYFSENLLQYSPFEEDLYNVLLDAVNERNKLDFLIETNERHLRDGNSSEAQAAFQLVLIRQLDKKERESFLLEAVKDQDQRLINWMKTSINLGQADIAEFIAKEWLKDGHRQVGKAFLYDILLQVAELNQDPAQISRWAFARFKQSLRIDYLKKINPALLENGPEALQSFIDDLRDKPDKFILLCTILKSLERWNELFEFLREEKSIPLLMKFDRFLFEKDLDQTGDLYVYLADEYLKSHLGHKASEQINTMLHHLQTTGYNYTQQRIKDLIRENYTDRHTLVNLLNEYQD